MQRKALRGGRSVWGLAYLGLQPRIQSIISSEVMKLREHNTGDGYSSKLEIW